MGQASREANRRWSLPLVSVAGVTVRVHVTFLALVVLVALSAGAEDESAGEAVGWLVVLFACVVVHELAHALVARSKGIEVHEIDLLPIGGVSRLERIPDRWRDEAAIAAAGPATSAAVSVLAFVAASAAGQPLLPAGVSGGPLLVRLGWVNLMLAVFNLLPAFPLDGGRVFRALLERDRSRVAATRQAARLSRVLALGMIWIGLLSNPWLVVIGFFVMIAGRAEEAAVLIHAALGPAQAHVLAVPCPVALPGDLPAGDAARLAAQHPQPAYPVTDPDGRTLGIVGLGALRRSPPTTPIGKLAAKATVEASTSLEDVAERMVSGPVAVTSDGNVVGVITVEALNAYLQEQLRQTDR